VDGRDGPDIRLPLLHQKLQMLQYCIARAQRETHPKAAASATATTTDTGTAVAAAVAAIAKEEEDEDEFFDTRESAEALPEAEAAGVGRRTVLAGVYVNADPTAPVYVPWTQEPGPMTEDAMDERVRQLEALGADPDAATARVRLQSTQLVSGTRNDGADAVSV
jgi:Rab3 GTPase-activating protein catalytic subunit